MIDKAKLGSSGFKQCYDNYRTALPWHGKLQTFYFSLWKNNSVASEQDLKDKNHTTTHIIRHWSNSYYIIIKIPFLTWPDLTTHPDTRVSVAPLSPPQLPSATCPEPGCFHLTCTCDDALFDQRHDDHRRIIPSPPFLPFAPFQPPPLPSSPSPSTASASPGGRDAREAPTPDMAPHPHSPSTVGRETHRYDPTYFLPWKKTFKAFCINHWMATYLISVERSLEGRKWDKKNP